MNSPLLLKPRFSELLADYEHKSLLDADETIYGMWPDFRLAFVNVGWMSFAELNGGIPNITTDWSLGRRVTDAIAEPLRPFFETNYEKCLREKRPWEHVYECSSAKLYRKFHMMTFPLGESEGFLVINSLRHAEAHRRVELPPIEDLYRNAQGIVVQCCHCRRVRRVGSDQTWDWVPDWVSTQPSNTSHSLCEPCVGFHYSPQRSTTTGFVEAFHTCG